MVEGVALPGASAVLALTEPQRYCVVDFRGWRAVFGEDRKSFSIRDYWRYRSEVARIAADLGSPVQEVDLAIWEYDRRQSEREQPGTSVTGLANDRLQRTRARRAAGRPKPRRRARR